MARVVAAAAIASTSGCWFDADYAGGHFKCSDGACPSGFTCVAEVCTSGAADAPTGHDARPIDGSTAHDGPTAALTCADPGALATAGGTASGTTVGRANTVSSECSGEIMNGPDAVYLLDVGVGSSVHVSITASYAATAYILTSCIAEPATPACEGSTAATPGEPIDATATSGGAQYVIVDGVSPTTDGTYTLAVTVQ